MNENLPEKVEQALSKAYLKARASGVLYGEDEYTIEEMQAAVYAHLTAAAAAAAAILAALAEAREEGRREALFDQVSEICPQKETADE